MIGYFNKMKKLQLIKQHYQNLEFKVGELTVFFVKD